MDEGGEDEKQEEQHVCENALFAIAFYSGQWLAISLSRVFVRGRSESDAAKQYLFSQIERFAIGLCVMKEASIDFANHRIVRFFQALNGTVSEGRASSHGHLLSASCRIRISRI